MADNTPSDAAQMHVRFVQEMQRLVTEFRDFATTMRADALWGINAHDEALHYEKQGFAYAPQRGGRFVGYDGPDDVRIPQEFGPQSGSLEAVKADLVLDNHRVRAGEEHGYEASARSPEGGHDRLTLPSDQRTTLNTIETLQHRVQQLSPPEPSRSQGHHRDQGMGW